MKLEKIETYFLKANYEKALKRFFFFGLIELIKQEIIINDKICN